ncbi:MAG: hypothetical protein ACR2FO_03225 [Actinomycetota bacterium]
MNRFSGSVAAMVVLSMAAAGCAKDPVVKDPVAKKGTPAEASASQTSPPGGSGGLTLIPIPTSPPAPAAGPAKPGSPKGPKAPGAPGAAPTNLPATGPVLSPAAAGTYLFATTGLTKIRGCLTLDQAPPNPTKLIVGALNGSRQLLERDERDLTGNGALTKAEVEYRADGIYLVSLSQSQTLLLSSLPTEFQAAPPVLLIPAGAQPGRTWSFGLVSKDGQVRAESQNKIEATNEQVTLARGQTVQATRISSTTRVTGQSSQGTLDVTRQMTTWYAPNSGLGIKESAKTTGRIGLCEVDSQIEGTLQSL